MAKIVVGIGSSQSPLVSIPAEHWLEYAESDKTNDYLFRADGKPVRYAELEAEAGDRLARALNLANLRKIAGAVKSDIAQLADDLAKAAPDVILVVADDQTELFDRDCVPAVSIYSGREISNKPRDLPPGTPPWMKGRYDAATIDGARHYPGHPEFADELIRRLIAKDIDVAVVKERTDRKRGIGHAWAFVANRLVGNRPIPIVPLVLNTWYPPNVPTPSRCYALGRALRAAIEESPESLRVAVIASGGMSHLVLNEELDRQAVAALRAGDRAALVNLPGSALLGGASQILDWIVLAGAVEALKLQSIRYYPAYRTPGGTGIGLAFARWS